MPSLLVMKRRPTILILENEEDDLFFFRRALAACQFNGELRVVESVAQARDYLAGRDVYCDRSYYPLPDLIVTDFKMHGQSGVDFLQWIAQQEGYKEIPVVMFSGTALPKDKEDAMASGALAFFTKTASFAEMREKVCEVLKYLPPRKP